MLVCLSAAAIAQKAPPARPFERFDGCVLKPDEWTDGDSFRVQLPDGRLKTFRLYFVDTTESRSRGERSDEQAAYFGLTRAQAIELGQQTKTFTANALSQPFTIYTRWRSVFGARFYAIVFAADGHDLENLRKAGWNCGSMTTTNDKGRSIWVVAAERSDAGRFIVNSDQELPAFLELESSIRVCGELL